MPGMVETQQADQCVWSRVNEGTVWDRRGRGPTDGGGQHEQDRGGPEGLWEIGVPGGYCAEEGCDDTCEQV